MLGKIKKFAGLLLTAIIFCTAALFVSANADSILGPISAAYATFVEAVEALQATPEPTPPRNQSQLLSAVITGELIPEASPVDGEPLKLTCPLFPYPELLSRVSGSTDTAVIILSGNTGTEGNLWLVKREDGKWYNAAGPLYCRLGADSADIAMEQTPAWRKISAGAEDITLGDFTLFGVESADMAPVSGVTLAERDMTRLLKLLDGDENARFSIFDAAESGWKIEKGMDSKFVFLTDYAPEIREDSKYATDDNFMGRPIDGYIGRRVVVTVRMAEALKEVNEKLAARGLGLLVYDGYRPGRAEKNFFDWIADEKDLTRKAENYPTLPKSSIGGVYLVRNSRHTRGIAVDLTLYDLVSGETLDMGTIFDFFSPLSWYKSDSVTPHQQTCRTILREAMLDAGFTPYELEWWHFNLDDGKSTKVYDFVIPQ